MKKRCSLLLAVVMVCSLLALPAQAAGPAGQAAESSAQAIADVLTSAYGSASVQYALIDGGKITQSGHAGVFSKTENRALTADTLYGIGSVSKMFTAASVMKLQQEGKLDLDQPVYTYLPDFRMADPRYKQITPRMLLNHSSGLYGSSFLNGFLYDDPDPYAHDHLLELLSTQQLKDDPGAFSTYCNDGFTLAELLVEKVSGMTFTDYIHQNFTVPLGMHDTYTPQDSFQTDDLARTYDAATGKETPRETLNVIGTGGIYSTAEDLCRFATLFTGDSTILTGQTREAMARDEAARGIHSPSRDGSMAFGLGWDTVRTFPFDQYGITALSKGGDSSLMHSSLVVLPEYGLAAAAVSSGGSSLYDQQLAAALLLDALKAKGLITEKELPQGFEAVQPQVVPQALKDSYSGFYGTTSYAYDLRFTDTGLDLYAPLLSEQPAEQYNYVGGGIFQRTDNTLRLEFREESNGKTYLWGYGYGVLKDLGPVASSDYVAEKLPDNPLDDAALAAWQARGSKIYLLVNEKYTSQSYASSLPLAAVNMTPGLPGYIAGARVVDSNTAVNAITTPGSAGRDAHAFRIFKEDGVEYLAQASGTVCIDAASLQPLYAGGASYCTIQPNGYTRWYTVPENAAGLYMDVAIPPNAGLAVYDANGICLSSTAGGEAGRIQLPQGGYIALIGEAGARFAISLAQ